MLRTILPSLSPATARYYHYVLLIGLASWLLLAGNADLPLIDRDEPRFAEAAREMMERGDWIIPYFNQEYRFDKPPMSYWLMRLSAGLLGGFSEFAVRLPASVSAGLVALMIYEMGRRRFEGMTGLWAAIGWLSCVQVLIHGRMAVADMPLIAAITGSTWAVWELLTQPGGARRWQVLLYLSLSVGFLAKGPLAIVCPLLTVLLYRFVFWRKPLPYEKLGLGWGIPLMLGLIGLWGIPALYLTDGLFWQQGMGRHVVERGMTPLNGRGFTPFFYLISSLFSLFPAIAWLGGAVEMTRKNWNADLAFLLAWLLGPYLIFSFYATQLSHYVLPAFPAAFLLLARSARAFESRRTWHTVIFAIVLGGGGLSTLLLLLMGWAETYSPEMAALRCFVLALAGVLGGLTGFALMVYRQAYRLALAALVSVGISLNVGSSSLRALSPALHLAELFQAMPSETAFYAVGFDEPSLVFYSHHHWKVWPGDAEGLNEVKQSGPRFILLLRDEIRLEGYLARYLPFVRPPSNKPWSEARRSWVEALATPESGYTVIHLTGINTARVSWVGLDVWFRTQ